MKKGTEWAEDDLYPASPAPGPYVDSESFCRTPPFVVAVMEAEEIPGTCVLIPPRRRPANYLSVCQ